MSIVNSPQVVCNQQRGTYQCTKLGHCLCKTKFSRFSHVPQNSASGAKRPTTQRSIALPPFARPRSARCFVTQRFPLHARFWVTKQRADRGRAKGGRAIDR